MLKDMKLESKPYPPANGYSYIISNMNNFMALNYKTAVCDEIVKRFNNYPMMLELLGELVYIAKTVDEVCFNTINSEDENNMKISLQRIIKEVEKLIIED